LLGGYGGGQQGRDDAFTSRHPALKTSKGTLQLRPEDAATIHDDELSDLVRAAVNPASGQVKRVKRRDGDAHLDPGLAAAFGIRVEPGARRRLLRAIVAAVL
jgi:hypothetical protein